MSCKNISGSLFGRLLAVAISAVLTSIATSHAQAGNVDLNFGDGTINALPGAVDASGYLAEYGITVSNIAPSGGEVVIEDDRDIYGGNGVIATSEHNLLTEDNTSNFQNNSFELDFSSPVSALSFYRVALIGTGSSGTIFPQWSATFYDDNTELGSVGESLAGYFSDVPAEQFSLPGMGNRLVIEGNDDDVAGYATVLIDDLAFTTVPEPSTWAVLVIGGAGLLAIRPRRSQSLA